MPKHMDAKNAARTASAKSIGSILFLPRSIMSIAAK